MDAVVPFFIFPLFIFIPFILLMTTALWIWMMIDCAVNEPPESNDRLVWILIIIFTHFLGAMIYLLVRRPQRMKQFGK